MVSEMHINEGKRETFWTYSRASVESQIMRQSVISSPLEPFDGRTKPFFTVYGGPNPDP